MTDIESSTALLRKLGDRYAALLEKVRSILRRTVSRGSGRVVRNLPGNRASLTAPCQVMSIRYGSSGSKATNPPSAPSAICQEGPERPSQTPLS